MNGIINKTLKHPSFPKIFFLCSVFILLITLIKVFVWIPPQFGSSLRQWVAREFIAPVAAGGIIVGYGINDFQGTPYSAIGFQTYCTTFLSILIPFVVGPVAFLSIGKRLKEIRSAGTIPSVLIRSGYAICFLWMIVVAVYFITATKSSYAVNQFMRNDNAVSKYRDDVVDGLSAICNAAQLYYILPPEHGGGGNTFLKNNRPLILSDLGFEKSTPIGRTILYQQNSDTILYLHFIGNRIGESNTNGNSEITHVVEYEVTISPSKYNINKIY